jgi:hypothetical protein
VTTSAADSAMDCDVLVKRFTLGSSPPGSAACGRFDRAAPMATCCLATSPVAAVLEALQAQLTSLSAAECYVADRRRSRQRARRGWRS